MQSNRFKRRMRNLFNPDAKEPYRLSRSRLENFVSCPRCFYLDRRLGIEPPGIPSFTLNSAVDELLKKEFDLYRRRHAPHPVMEAYGIEAIPSAHPMIDEWRENFRGIQYHHPATNLIIQGAVDDIWVDKKGQLFVVDYKSTSTNEAITLDSQYRESYKRQMEVYQWLLRQLKFDVSNTGYFVYCNADKSKEAFNATLTFKIEIITYIGSVDWVEPVILEAHKCLLLDELPDASNECEYCLYRQISVEVESQKKQKTFIKAQGELF